MHRETDGMIGTEWQCVEIDDNFVTDLLPPPSEALQLARAQLKWLREYDGYGKYYTDNIFKLIYFERDEDREIFLLKWT